MTISSSDQPPPGSEPTLGGHASNEHPDQWLDREPDRDPDRGPDKEPDDYRDHYPGKEAPDPRARFLRDDLNTLWPLPGQVVSTGRQLRRPREGMAYAVLPNSRHPALLLPTNHSAVAAMMLRNYKTSASSRSRAKFRVMALAARAGALRLLPDQMLVHESTGDADSDLVGHLRRVLGHEVHVAVYMGAPRANRKPVLQILGPGAETLAFAKVGTNALTRRLVRHEASALTLLASRPMGTVTVPPLLHDGPWHGHQILVQGALGQDRASGSAFPSALERAMVEVAGLDGIAMRNARASGYWRRLHERISDLHLDPQGAGLKDALIALDPVAASTEMAFGAWHGDWTPWNMLAQGNRIQVWDWERFETDVPVGFDAFHFALQRAVSRDREQAGPAARRLLERSTTLLAPFGVPTDSARLVATLYLLDLGARYLKDRQYEAGAALGNLSTWLLPVVSDSSQSLRVERS